MSNIHNAIAIIFCLVGLVGFITPTSVARLVGFEIEDVKGRLEAQAIYGGFFLGLGLVAIITRDQSVFTALGVACITASVTRFIGFMLVKAQVVLNISMVLMITELIAGIFLIVR